MFLPACLPVCTLLLDACRGQRTLSEKWWVSGEVCCSHGTWRGSTTAVSIGRVLELDLICCQWQIAPSTSISLPGRHFLAFYFVFMLVAFDGQHTFFSFSFFNCLCRLIFGCRIQCHFAVFSIFYHTHRSELRCGWKKSAQIECSWNFSLKIFFSCSWSVHFFQLQLSPFLCADCSNLLHLSFFSVMFFLFASLYRTCKCASKILFKSSWFFIMCLCILFCCICK